MVQEAADRNDTTTLYLIICNLTGSPSGQRTSIKECNDSPLLTKEEQDTKTTPPSPTPPETVTGFSSFPSSETVRKLLSASLDYP
ncbi:uncharacterized protein DAT39_014373 [Clarias magur]|uniref:Uncharacterized protein n=1 Tax=Clarias magur TaxID=1594786 RepID=A0A8J4UJD0_CLAMG|nr:uncharacterized protein DAT39_014373 [Clarias magur]